MHTCDAGKKKKPPSTRSCAGVHGRLLTLPLGEKEDGTVALVHGDDSGDGRLGAVKHFFGFCFFFLSTCVRWRLFWNQMRTCGRVQGKALISRVTTRRATVVASLR